MTGFWNDVRVVLRARHTLNNDAFKIGLHTADNELWKDPEMETSEVTPLVQVSAAQFDVVQQLNDLRVSLSGAFQDIGSLTEKSIQDGRDIFWTLGDFIRGLDGYSNFGRSFLGCTEADFTTKGSFCRMFSRSTRLTRACIASDSTRAFFHHDSQLLSGFSGFNFAKLR